MTEVLKNVPAETRLTIASQTLTGAIIATNKVLLDIVGEEKYNEIIGQIWSEGGKASKQIADSLGLVGNDAKSISEINPAVATVEMGPEFKFETLEATTEKAIVRCTECPWWNRAKELAISEDMCSVGDHAWNNGLAKAINPKLNVKLTKAMPLGDTYCEWVYEL